jgi:hypothetical protein
MKNKKKVIIQNGSGTGLIIFLIFLTLKLTNVIDWSWVWVFSPFWVGPLLLLSIVAIVFIIGFITIIIKHTLKKNKKI